jgi:N-acetylglucosaminyldiphosphoundecaprenol N-acetyl-beta-D-mannosaminyltransferase
MDESHGKQMTLADLVAAADLASGVAPAFAGAPGSTTSPLADEILVRPPLPISRLMGVELHSVTEAQAIEHIIAELANGHGGVTVTPNLDHLRRCRTDLQFAALVAEAELVVADGMPLIWASRIAGCPLPERVAGSDLILTLSAAAAVAKRSIYLLGGAGGTAEGAADVLTSRHPDLKIAGLSCPPVGFEASESEMAKLVADLVDKQPDIVFVALGSPKQEYLIERIRSSLPKAWWVGVGVSFSFLTGHVQRAPKLLQRSGLEWTHRLMQEPRRLFKRYVVHGLPFAAQLFSSAAAQRVNAFLGNDTSNERSYPRPNRSIVAIGGHSFEDDIAHGAEPFESVRDSTGTRGTRDLASGGDALSRLKAIVLLSGQLRPSPLMQAVQRCTLDLPIAEDRTLLNHWLADSVDLAKFARVDGLPVRVLVSRQQDRPTSLAPRYQEILSIETDGSEFRGTGGVLSDITRGYDDDDFVLVANASQLLLEPMSALATALDHKRADIALISHLDGTPGGLMLIRCKTLRQINPIGFVDLKEQALPLIAGKFDVRVVNCRRPTGLPLRTTADYISALRQWHRGPGRLPGSRRGQIDPLAEDFSRGYAIVENGAWVDSTAYLHDTVVLRGARVEAGVAAVRSLIGPRALVKRDTRAIDTFVNS